MTCGCGPALPGALTLSVSEEILLQPGGFLVQGSVLLHALGVLGTPDTGNASF